MSEIRDLVDQAPAWPAIHLGLTIKREEAKVVRAATFRRGVRTLNVLSLRKTEGSRKGLRCRGERAIPSGRVTDAHDGGNLTRG
jgi:hypothetical protein